MNTNNLQEKSSPTSVETRKLYIDLIKKCLIGTIYADYEFSIVSMSYGLKKMIGSALDRFGMQLVRRVTTQDRLDGRVWPMTAHTMIGVKRLDNVQQCVEDVLKNNIPGDFIEAGVWRGGTCIFMRALLKAYGVQDRSIWVADSFEGLPKPTHEKDRVDLSGDLFKHKELAISLEQVQSNFAAYDLLDNQVKFLKGWFKDTLSKAPINQLAIARLDGDLYESTMDGLMALYPKLSIGGYLIIDDYNSILACKQAVHDYRQQQGISEPIKEIDIAGVYWRKEK